MIELRQIFLMVSVLTTLTCATIGFAQVPGPDEFNVRNDSLSRKNDTVKLDVVKKNDNMNKTFKRYCKTMELRNDPVLLNA